MTMLVIVFGELDVEVMGVIAVAQNQPRREGVGFGNDVSRFEIAVACLEVECLDGAVRARGGDLDVAGPRDRTVIGGKPEARRNTVLEDTQADDAMARVDPARLVVGVVMIMLVMDGVLLAPCGQQHPCGDTEDDHGRGQLEPALRGFDVEELTEVKTGQGDRPDDGRVRQGRRKPEQYRLPDRPAHGDDEGRHHGLGMPRLKTVKRPEKEGRGNEQPGMGRALREQVRKRSHRRLTGIW